MAKTPELIELNLEAGRPVDRSGTDDHSIHATSGERDAENGAPAREPEVWDAGIAAFNPHLANAPEPEPLAVSPDFASQNFDIGEYLAEERAKDLLRFSTAGSVDDGKSTLIGRLLYDTQSVYDDQIQSIEGKGTTAPGVLDLALLTDGLRAEREQGITIDVAYRYFSTPHRKFIIADTPGHEQYTRNMATGASTADVAIVLIDARKGVLIQSQRHAYITALLGVRNIIVAVNKMDLVGYDAGTFGRIVEDFTTFFRSLDVDGQERTELHFVPVSALAGDNVVHLTAAMPWYTGPSLLTLLETLPSSQTDASAPFRFAVQRVIRPNLDFRGFAGQIASGTVKPGDRITVLPSGRHSRVQRIVTFDGDLDTATAPLSVTLTLEDEIDISRGDLLVGQEDGATVTSQFVASLVWMENTPLQTGRRYLLKQTSRTVQAQVSEVRRLVKLPGAGGSRSAEDGQIAVNHLVMNGIAEVLVKTLQPVAVDPYANIRHTGSFVLIDPQTNLTIAAGMIRRTEAAKQDEETRIELDAVTSRERSLRFGHTGAQLVVVEGERIADALERALFERGAFVVRLEAGDAQTVSLLVSQGVLVITGENGVSATQTPAYRVNPAGEDDAVAATVAEFLRKLQTAGVLLQGGGAQ